MDSELGRDKCMCNFLTCIQGNEDPFLKNTWLKMRCNLAGGVPPFRRNTMLQRYSEDVGNKPQTTRPHNSVNNVCNFGPDIFWKADILNI